MYVRVDLKRVGEYGLGTQVIPQAKERATHIGTMAGLEELWADILTLISGPSESEDNLRQ
jgi:hypothetical protein